MYVPYMVNSDSLQGTGQLLNLKKICLSFVAKKEYYLIPTSEVPTDQQCS